MQPAGNVRQVHQKNRWHNERHKGIFGPLGQYLQALYIGKEGLNTLYIGKEDLSTPAVIFASKVGTPPF